MLVNFIHMTHATNHYTMQPAVMLPTFATESRRLLQGIRSIPTAID